MAKVYPFRAIHFDPAKVGDLSNVLGQPYDKIDDRLQEEYYRKHPYHIVRIDKTKEEPGKDRYATAQEHLERYLADRVLVQEDRPAFYAYYQIYNTPQGQKVRKGFSAMVKLEEFGKGRIYPHEETHHGPKVDRFNLLSATRLHIGHIFMLYSDEKKKINTLLDGFAKEKPMLEARDDYGELHRVWPITDPRAIRTIQSEMEGKSIIIADGHHRYETALNFLKQNPKLKGEGAESHENVLATLINMEDEGLTIYPTHRAVREAPDFGLASFKSKVADFFEIREYAYADEEEEKSARRELLEDLRIEGYTRTCFGMIARDVPMYFLLAARDRDALIRRIESNHSDDWKSLDVNILHSVILNDILGITPDDLAHEKKVDYYRWADEVIAGIRANRYQLGFLVNPVKVSQIKAVTKRWERFPQKTTDFYPKLLSGLLMCRLNVR